MNETHETNGPSNASTTVDVLSSGWAGPPQRAWKVGEHTIDDTVAELIENIGSGKQVLEETEAVTIQTNALGHLLSSNGDDALAELTADGYPTIWVAEVLARRVWALSQAMHRQAATPVFGSDSHTLVSGAEEAHGEMVLQLCRARQTPDPRKVLKNLNGAGSPAIGLCVITAMLEAVTHEAAAVLDGWDAAAIWVLLWPGSKIPSFGIED